MLLRYYLNYFANRYGDKQITFSEGAINALQQYHWPGNVRQLRNEIERLITYSVKGDVISIDDLSLDIQQSNSLSMLPRLSEPQSQNLTSSLASKRSKILEFPESPKTLRDVVRPVERELILAAFERNQGNFSKVAKELGLSRRGLKLKIDSLNLSEIVSK
ncbi:MAG: hypothetical protein IPK14_01075 [Blastocatellia bacterium]|nr:hypothetical protein [Blastocatellia bacterium]